MWKPFTKAIWSKPLQTHQNEKLEDKTAEKRRPRWSQCFRSILLRGLLPSRLTKRNAFLEHNRKTKKEPTEAWSNSTQLWIFDKRNMQTHSKYQNLLNKLIKPHKISEDQTHSYINPCFFSAGSRGRGIAWSSSPDSRRSKRLGEGLVL